MILEEVIPRRIVDLLAASIAQHDMVLRLIVEVEPSFRTSQLRMLLESRRWPHAVIPSNLIDPGCEADQAGRADAILSRTVAAQLGGKRFLDFGCGEGYAVRAAEKRGAMAIGYDILKQWGDNPSLTTDWDVVREKGPYEAVLVYDVLDHSREEHPIDCLKRIRGVLAPEGVVYLRLHPWCSRHGTHCYTGRNKAFLHLFFTAEELEEMGAPGIYSRKVTHPLTSYEDWVLKGGFRTISQDVRRDALEPFWEEEEVLRKVIQGHWKNSYEESLASGEKFPTYQMEQSWVDFRLVVDGG